MPRLLQDLAVADEEQAALRAEVERLRQHIRDNVGGRINGLEANDWFQIATAKEQALDAAVTKLAAVEALADEMGSAFPYVRVADIRRVLGGDSR